MATISFDTPPKDALAYLRQKHPELHFDYDEIMHEAHHKAFTVAKITRLDLLSDIQASLIKAKEEGKPFAEWKKEIKPILQKKGWWGKIETVNPKTGEIKRITVGSRRLRTIFYTNSRVAYNVGRWKHQSRLEHAPYLRYVAILDGRVRPRHKAHHGIIRHRDDPFWQTNYPPNGWNCRCRVQAYSKEEIEARGWEDKLSQPTQNIADKDWAYDIRAGSLDALEKYRKKRILNAPKDLREKAEQELHMDNMYLEAIRHTDARLSSYLIAHRPHMVYREKPSKNIPGARYAPATKTVIFYESQPEIWFLRHELGHHVDYINGWFSTKKLQASLAIDASMLLRVEKSELKKVLEKYHNPAIHDLFYLNYPETIGVPTRKEKIKTDKILIRKETFANIFEIILSADNRMSVVEKYFPNTYAKIVSFLETLQ